MTSRPGVQDVEHPALLTTPDALPLSENRLTDQARLGLVLEAAAVASHLERAGRGLARGFAGAAVSADRLVGVEAAPGRSPEPLQVSLTELLRRLFRARGGIAGRGAGRRAARDLLARWDQRLVALAPDELVAQVLRAAPFLWEDAFAGARRALVAGHRRGGAIEPWIAGPPPWRHRLLREGGDRSELEALVSGRGARGLWEETVERRRGGGGGEGEPALERGRSLLAAGRYQEALALLSELPLAEAAGPRLWCLYLLGRLGAARKLLGEVDARALPARALPAVAEVAVRVLTSGGDVAGARDWVARALSRTRGRDRLAAHLLAAMAAWDRGERDEMERHLKAAAEARSDPALAWRRHHAASAAAMLAGRHDAACESLGRALLSCRRRLARHEAAGLWNDLGVARARAGDLAGAERAFLHTFRLWRVCDGPRRTTHALGNLAEVRLRRGRTAGAEEMLVRSRDAHRRAGNRRGLAHDTAVLARAELVRGRPREALALCREGLARTARGAPTGFEPDLHALAARALGWLGRTREAAAELARLARPGGDAGDEGWAEIDLEPEERPALWALAGDEARARRCLELAPEAPGIGVWRALLGADGEEAAAGDEESGAEARAAGSPGRGRGGRSAAAGSDGTGRAGAGSDETGREGSAERATPGVVPAAAWEEAGRLEPLRLARLVFDCELFAPGAVPAAWRRRAVATFRRLGARLPAERLEAADGGAWEALAAWLARDGEGPEPKGEEAALLFAAAGYPEARLSWEPPRAAGEEVEGGAEPVTDLLDSDGDRPQVWIAGAGGREELSGELHGGRLVLSVDRLDAAARALFHLLRREAAHRPRPSGGEPGSPRAGREGSGGALAAGSFHGLVGESPALAAALERLRRFAATDLPVLVRGESGTGKELAARALHRLSARAERPFVPVNCAALSETLILSELFGHVRGAFTGAERDRAGVFETAAGGSVFLDEIGDLPAAAQGMLLRVLQEGEVRRLGEVVPRQVDVRVVAATHRDLAAMAEAGEFRGDLLFRLRGAAVELPRLAERGADLDLLADHLLDRLAQTTLSGLPRARLSPGARQRLAAHDWPGNVRELGHVLASAAALAGGGVIEPEHLDLDATGSGGGGAGTPGPAAGGYHEQVEALRRRLVRDALAATDGHQAEAARRLGISRQALSYLVRQLELD